MFATSRHAEWLQLEPLEIADVDSESVAVDPQVIVVRPSDPSTDQLMRAVEVSGTLAFWDDPREDAYTIDDGEPL